MSSVAVIVVCRNEEKHIRRCLDSLLANDYDHRLMTILVVDGMSTDGTRQIVAEYSQKHGLVRLVDNPRKVIPAALNTGIRVAGEIGAQVLLRVDAHAVYAPNYISTLVRGLEQYGADNIGGIRETYPGNTPWGQAVAIVWCHPFAAANAVFRTALGANRPRPVDTVWCGCFRMSVFDRIGVFNELALRAEDRDFNARLRRSGGKIILEPSARCTYFPRTGLAEYVRHAFTNGFWVYYAQRFSELRLVSIRNLVPLGFVVWHILAALLGLLWPSSLPWMLAPIAAYWILNLAVSAHAAWKRRSFPLFPCLFLLFAATHYFYGMGNLWGLIRATIQGKPAGPARARWLDEAAKRAFDIVFAATGLLLGLPLLVLVAVVIKLDSSGPIFYRGVRIGRGFKPFRVFKFRTMVANAEQLGGSTASRYDPRITRVGRFLRRTKLDELPNLINVLIGQMSLVGPRPEVKFYTDKYTEEERAILSVRPGITDFASLEFAHQQALIGDEDPERDFQARVLPRKNALRLKYARERSFWVDMRILGATFWLFFSKPFQWIGQRFRRKR